MTTIKLESLHQLGLDDRQISIYQALLRLGPASIRDVAAESGINRGSTYETLKQLATKGIVSYFPKGRRRVFQAEDPERLLSLGESKQQALSVAMDQLRKEIIPALKQTQSDFSLGNVRFYEGDDGVELVLRATDASYIAIYPPKVAMITLASDKYPVVVIIDSSAIASTQQILFDTLWNLL